VVTTGRACLAGARLAVNDFRSYSGCVALRAAVAEMLQLQYDGAAKRSSRVNFFDPRVLVTGGHRASVQAVLDGDADCASIDCVTWALLQSECAAATVVACGDDAQARNPSQSPLQTAGLRVVAETPLAPAPPFVVPKELEGTEAAEALFGALLQATTGAAAAAVTATATVATEGDGAPAPSSALPPTAPFEQSLFLASVVRASPSEYANVFSHKFARFSPILARKGASLRSAIAPSEFGSPKSLEN
jgi:ABC-type phosphate/phosphonate transport system substrate-binding protein